MYIFFSGIHILDKVFACGLGKFCGCGSRKINNRSYKKEKINFRVSCIDFVLIDEKLK
tara:strand:+ start:1747 stop:1920 length:174 start_codon:yes stop_codon:yes gene_type:complete